MASCSRSGRALQTFAKDLAGIRFRQQRPHIHFHQQRRFGTRPPFRQVESAISARLDDGFVPFDTDVNKAKGSPMSSSIAESETKGTIAELESAGLDEDWHAELEIAPETKTSVPQNSRAESRLRRKLRRIEAGKYSRMPKGESLGEGVAGDRVQTVLEKIEAMEGPSVRDVKTAKRQIRDEVQHAEKERRSTSYTSKEDSSEPRRSTGKAEKDTGKKTSSATDSEKVRRETWQTQKDALEQKFGEAGWQPRKRLSPDTLDGIRALHASDPASYTTATLAEHFEITPEAIRRILKSKWRPREDEVDDRRRRWERRGVEKWQAMAEQGVRPPAKWRAMGIGSRQAVANGKSAGRRGEDEFVRWDGDVQDRLGDSVAERIL